MFHPRADPYLRHAPASASRGGGVGSLAAMHEKGLGSSGGNTDRREVRHAADPILAAVGNAFCLRNAHQLFGMAHGQRREVGVCEVNGRPVTWDYWFPHLGIAVDTLIDRETAVVKSAWAPPRGVYYLSPFNHATESGQIDLDLLSTMAHERRGH